MKERGTEGWDDGGGQVETCLHSFRKRPLCSSKTKAAQTPGEGASLHQWKQRHGQDQRPLVHLKVLIQAFGALALIKTDN